MFLMFHLDRSHFNISRENNLQPDNKMSFSSNSVTSVKGDNHIFQNNTYQDILPTYSLVLQIYLLYSYHHHRKVQDKFCSLTANPWRRIKNNRSNLPILTTHHQLKPKVMVSMHVNVNVYSNCVVQLNCWLISNQGKHYVIFADTAGFSLILKQFQHTSI